jgi:hypothetical protein
MSGPKRIMLYYGAHGHNQGFQRMRSLIVAAAVACGIVSVCLTGPSGAQAPQKFNPRVCNASGSDAIFAVIVRTAPNMWRVRGWYDVTNQRCTELTAVLGPGFYAWAINERGTVWEDETHDKDTIWACLFEEKFDYDATKSPTCGNRKGAFIPIPGGKYLSLQ